MDYGNMVGESFEYAKEAVVGKWNKWVMLIIATILLGLPLAGYAMKVLRGEKPAPEVDDWGTLFIDGIKVFIVALIYTIPIYIIVLFFLGGTIATAIVSGSSNRNPAAVFATIGIGIVAVLVVYFIMIIFEIIGMVRFARTGKISEAFNFNAILATIGKLGWGPYIVALIVLGVINILIYICLSLIMLIPFIGILIYLCLCLCLIAPLTLMQVRYVCLLYDSAGSA